MKMGKKVKEYKSGDFIFAKVKGYPAWPARVQRQNGKKYFVYFYGTGETANLPPNMIFDYSENKEKFLNKSVKRKDFNDGVKQIEHDFANNVPLEQVVGALAAQAPADDTLNDAAEDGADDSAAADAAADTTADDAVDEAAEPPVEDSDDAGALVIDEGKAKGKKSTAKPAATPKAAKEAKTPRGRPRKEDAKEAREPEPEEDKKEEEVISRSGRKIRPKRYMDEAVEEPAAPSPAAKKRRGASPAPAAPDKPDAKDKPQDKNIKAYNTVQQSELRELKEPFKSADPEKENILITYLPSGQICGVKLFQSRPASFKNEASRLQWDKQAASNAITLKRQLEKGQITPQSISAQLVMDLNLTEDEKKALDKDRDLEVKKARLHFLKTEMKLIELDAKIKTCLSLEKADTDLCLKLIDEILELDLAALMLLKHPTCMETVKRMRVYVGNTPSWEMSEGDALTFSRQAHRIRNQADALFITMRDLFEVPEGVSFWEYFTERVALFKSVTDNLHADKLLEMVHEPIEMSQPTPLGMKAAVEAAAAAAAAGAANHEHADDAPHADADHADKKKKATPAKGKKANSTPLKQPLKRQSSRKQQQEDKEKDKEPEKPAEDIPEEPDTNKTNDTEKSDAETPKENDKTANKNDKKVTENDKSNEADKPNENEPDEADREVEKVNEKSDKSNEKEQEKPENEKAEGDSEKEKDAAKEKESNSKEKGDNIESKSNDTEDKTDEKESGEKDKSSKNSKKKESDKTNDKSKDNGKSKDKSKDDKEKSTEKKDDAKNGKEKAKAGDKRKEKGGEKEKSEEKEKVDADEPRAKRSRETKKTEPPPRSPAKRKSKS